MADATNPIVKKMTNPQLAITTKLTVATGSTIYEGTLVCINASGEATSVVTTTKCAGIAVTDADATENVIVESNIVVRIALSGVAASNIGDTAYAADNQTATLTANTAILGRIVNVDTGYAWVYLTLRA